MRVAYFAHNIDDAAIRRRAHGFAALGCEVTTYSMRRGEIASTPWENVDLGRTHDGRFAQRIAAALAAGPRLLSHRDDLKRADLWVARNLDMAALAAMTRAAIGASAPLVYECLDIHRFMSREDGVGGAMRALERTILTAASATIVSSPAFIEKYFEPRFGALAKTVLVENRLAFGVEFPSRPAPETPRPARPLTVGWFGNLRCRRSLALMRRIARIDGVAVVLRGYAAKTEIPDFEAQIAAEPNVSFGGRYAYPDDLAAMYGAVDLVWAGDYHDADANSAWLLPNRLYEGGYFGVPPIAPAASQTGRWLAERGLGLVIGESVEDTLPALLATLTPAALAAARAQMLAAPEAMFRQTRSDAQALLERLNRRREPEPAARSCSP